MDEQVGHIADSEIRRYLREIETNETQYLGGLLREIYEQRLQDVFQVELEIEVERHDATIESICHHHYSKLASAMQELRQICKLVERLKNQVTKINAKIQESGSLVIQANENYAHIQRQRRNVNLTIEKMEECLPMLANYQKMKKHYGNGEYYRALKMIQTIEYVNLPAVSSSISFHQIISKKLPIWKNNISDSTRRLMRKWLEESKSHAAEIGKAVIERHRKRFYLDQTLTGDDDIEEDEVAEEDKLISLTDIFKCLHISTLTNDMLQFKEQFTNDRHDQLKQFVATPTFNIISCQHYVATLIGFLHIEQELQASSPHLSRSVQDIWLKFEQRVCATFRSYQSQINSEDEYKEIKFLLSALYHALFDLNLETGSIVQIQRELQRQYLEVLLRTFSSYFDGIVTKDDFTPLRVSNEAEEFEIHQSFPLDADTVDANLNELESPNDHFPKKLPFSKMVLRIFGKMRNFIDEYLMYMNGLEIAPVEKEELSRKAMTTLIRRPLRDALKKKTEQDNIGLNTLMQLSINIGCLESACGELCAYISKKTQVHSEASQLNIGADSFKDIRSEVEGNIRERIVYKIQENIELGFDMFDYGMTDDPIGPSDHIRTTLDFLDNNIKMLKKLSDKVQATTLFYVCSQLNTTLLQWLLDDGYCSQISFNSLRQIMIDVNYLENYATINNPESAEAFEAIHQLLDLLIKNDWNGYISSYSQPTSLYLRVRPSDARKVFVKINWDSEYNSHGGMRDRMKAKQNELSRRKLNDEIVKKLINLENGR